MKVIVESVVKLDEDQIKPLTDLLVKKLGDGVSIKFVVNRDVLGGLRVTVGSRRIDVSLRGKLDQVKKQLE